MVSISGVNKSILEKLRSLGFNQVASKTPYEIARFESVNPKATIIYYTTKKLLIQASKENEILVCKKLGFGSISSKIKIKKEEVYKQNKEVMSALYVGSDETLKGDTFGGLVVCGVLCDEYMREKLREVGVDDSKKITDGNIFFLANKIREIVGENHISVKNVFPKEYNQNTQTNLMNTLHRQVFIDLTKDKKATHIVDKYPGCNVGDIIETKAESKYIEVAAASILAREAGLKQLDELSKKAGFKVPKGSTHVKNALLQLKNSGLNPLEFVKMHFKNVQKALM